MTNANECTCPSGDGSLRHPCPAHPAPVEQAGEDERDLQAEGAQGEREAFEAAYPELISLCRWNEEKQEYNSGSGGLGWQDGLQATQWLRVWKKARAALALARVAELERKLRNEENAHTTTIEQRDNAEHWADQLANAIAERFGVDIGEHSNLNCPWNEALVWMQQPPAQAQHSVPEEVRTLLSRAQCEIEHLAECLENVCEDEEDFDVREDVADGRVVAADIAHMLAAAPGKEGL